MEKTLLRRSWPRTAPQMSGKLVQFSHRMKRWECVICGYIHEGDEPPDVCPVCGAAKEFFRLLDGEAPGFG